MDRMLYFPSTVAALRDELRQDAIRSIRWRLWTSAVLLAMAAPPIAAIMEALHTRPLGSWLVAQGLAIAAQWWWLLVPAALVAHRIVEVNLLRRLSLSGLRLVARLVLVGAAVVAWQLCQGGLLLITNVG